jgi:hypothetical protein
MNTKSTDDERKGMKRFWDQREIKELPNGEEIKKERLVTKVHEPGSDTILDLRFKSLDRV